MTYTTPYLLTGVTGGLGAKVLEEMLNTHKVTPSSIIVTSRSSKSREKYEALGLQFRELDYDRPETIATAMQGVDNVLFVSSSEFNNETRYKQHQNMVDGAKAAGVGTTWYVSLAFGGFEVDNKVSVQIVHNQTEEMLVKSGINFVSLRAGLYADAFPLFLNWYPSSKSINLPELDPPVTEGQTGMTSRDELGEGIATLFTKGLAAFPSIKPRTERNIVLLTANQTTTFFEVAEAIHDNHKPAQPIKFLPPEEWVTNAAENDEGGKPIDWFKTRLGWFEQMDKGALKTIDPALKVLLGREPLKGSVAIAKLLQADPNFTWHQNYAPGSGAKKRW